MDRTACSGDSTDRAQPARGGEHQQGSWEGCGEMTGPRFGRDQAARLKAPGGPPESGRRLQGISLWDPPHQLAKRQMCLSPRRNDSGHTAILGFTVSQGTGTRGPSLRATLLGVRPPAQALGDPAACFSPPERGWAPKPASQFYRQSDHCPRAVW